MYDKFFAYGKAHGSPTVKTVNLQLEQFLKELKEYTPEQIIWFMDNYRTLVGIFNFPSYELFIHALKHTTYDKSSIYNPDTEIIEDCDDCNGLGYLKN